MDITMFQNRANFYMGWKGHSSFPRYYGVRDGFIDALTVDEKRIMTELGFFDSQTKNGKRFEKAIQSTLSNQAIDEDFYQMLADALNQSNTNQIEESVQPGNY